MALLKTQAPTVSVCIPTYRGRAAIGAAIESVLAQDFTDFELIVIDDGSPDDTDAIVERFSDSRLVYPVSYTHLDVYKRQNKGWLTGLALLLSASSVNACLLYTSRCV